MDESLQVFADESRELLVETEDLLLELESRPQDPALIDALFRAVHTIKGAAGLFGFDDVVAFTHTTESVMGRLRDGELVLGDDLSTLFLKCRDQTAMLVEHALEDEGELAEDVRATGDALEAQLLGYLGGATDPASLAPDEDLPPIAPEDVADTGPGDGSIAEVAGPGRNHWHISLRFGCDVFRNGMDPLSFLRYLLTVGDIVSITTIHDALPDSTEMDAESCYLGFEIDLRSDADKEAIEGVFEFVQDDCQIHILAPHSHISQYLKLIDELPEENLRVGEILTMSGALTRRELDEALQAQAASSAPDEDGRGGAAAPPIGEVVVGQGVVEQPVVDAALGKQDKVKHKKSLEQQSVRVNAGKLEALINLVGELVISSANTEVLARRGGDPGLREATEHMARLVEEIRDAALGMRMVQVGETFNRFRRVVREMSREVGKDIDLRISGGDTELDKTVVEKIGDPLMHLVRNAIDHGIEPPGLRAERAKPAKAVVSLNAYHDSGSIVIEVADDGGGLPRDKILAKALERELVKPSQSLTDKDILRLIFEPGFSTADAVTNISGRGVGMDVVRRNIDALRGQVDVESTPGEGSKFIIRLPLTLAIIDGFQVRVGDASYVIPLDLVVECIELDDGAHHARDKDDYVNLRGEVLPYVRLGQLFRGANGAGAQALGKHRDNIVVVQFAGQKTGLVVDELLGEHQTVIKPLGQVFQHLRGISGATILGSGEVAMIVDVPGLVQRVVTRH